MDLTLLVSTVQDGSGGAMIWGTFSPQPVNHGLNATLHPSIVGDHVRPFMATLSHLPIVMTQHVTKKKSSPTNFMDMTMS